MPVLLYITRFRGEFQGISGSYRKFIGFRGTDLGSYADEFQPITHPVGARSQPAPRTCVVMQDGALRLVRVVAAMQGWFVVAAGGAAGAGGADGLDEPDESPEPAPDLRSEGLSVFLESVRRRLFSMRASRAFTSSNSEVVTMYWSRAGRMRAISSWE